MSDGRQSGRDLTVPGPSANAVSEAAEAAKAARATGQAEEILSAIELLPPERRGVLTQVLISQETYSGPIPSPRVLAGMDVVVPGSARQIVDMALSQQKHDHSYSDRILSSESNYRLITFLGAVFILLLLIVGAVVCALYHETTVAVTLGSVTGLSLLAGVLIKGRDLFPTPGATATPARPESKRPSTGRPSGQGRAKPRGGGQGKPKA